MKVIIDKIGGNNFRIAVIDGNGILQDLHYNTTVDQLRGRIYIGYISRIESSLQAAFVEYGSLKKGFLPFVEVSIDDYNISSAERKAAQEREQEEERDGRVNEDSDEQDEDNKFNAFDVGPLTQINESQVRNSKFYRKYRIQDVLEVGQIVLVQVTKEERGHKGVTLSTYINLSDRTCILLANTPQRSRISDQITDEKERIYLDEVINKLSIPEEMSIVIRNTDCDKNFSTIKNDFAKLLKTWSEIKVEFKKNLQRIKEKNYRKHSIPKLLHNDRELIGDFLRDHWSKNYHTIVVSGKELYQRITKTAREILQKSVPKIILLNNPVPIFTYFNIERQIANLYQNAVQLASGGHIVINKTEALVAIDINSGRMTSERDVEDTAFRANIEAIPTVVRQICLRELSGIIVIDFIDMMEANNRKIVEQELYAALAKYDRAKIKISKISPLGLVEMSRQRLRSSFQEIFTNPCNMCSGRGHLRNIYETGFAIIRAIETDFFLNEFVASEENKITCTLHTNNNIAIHLLNEERVSIGEIEKKLNITIKIVIDNKIYQDMFKIQFIDENVHEKNICYIRDGKPENKKLSKPDESLDAEPEKEELDNQSTFSTIIKQWIGKIINK